ncbi:MAG: type II toxin-antitoxin system antitoxin SocA domain-containing protein [Solirubrobacterales bacterium]
MDDTTKLKELILYLAQKMEEEQHVGRGRIKLAKLLWRSDFAAFWRFGAPITEAQYQADRLGPAPVNEMLALRDLEGAGRLELLNEWDQQQIPVAVGVPADLNVFAAAEIALVDDQLRQYRLVTARAMVDEAHEFPGWINAWRGGTGKHSPIPFESVFWDGRTELEPWEEAYARVLAAELGISS